LEAFMNEQGYERIDAPEYEEEDDTEE
jgi:hypothetical protein